jgi:hypothetical protein
VPVERVDGDGAAPDDDFVGFGDGHGSRANAEGGALGVDPGCLIGGHGWGSVKFDLLCWQGKG